MKPWIIAIAIIIAGCNGETSSTTNTTSNGQTSDAKLSPSGLTIVICDSGNSVLDTVVIADDQQSRVVRITIPQGMKEIRVFVIGNRIEETFKSWGTFTDNYLIGRATDQLDGAGYIEAGIENGILIGISPQNGIEPLTLSAELKKQIEEDIVADQRAPITTIKLKDE